MGGALPDRRRAAGDPMTLRTRVLLTTSLILIVLIASVLVLGQITLRSALENTEQLETERDVQRVLAAYSELLASIDSNVSDWATWDDAYAFVADGNGEFVRSNLVDQTFGNLGVNAIIFVDGAGNIVFSRQYDLVRSQAMPDSPALLADTGAGSTLLRHALAGDGTQGLLLLPEGPLAFVARPILTSEGKGPSRGLLLMGRYLDSATIDHIRKLTLLDVAIRRLDRPGVAAMSPNCNAPSAAAPISVCTLSEERIAGYTQMSDANGTPAIMVEVSEPRTTYTLWMTARQYFFGALFTVGSILIGAILWLLESRVLSRVAKTSLEVSRIGAQGNFGQRVSTTGTDEIGILSQSINHMLDVLQASQQAVQDRADELTALHATALELSAVRDSDALLESIVANAVQLLRGDSGALYLVDPQRQQVRCAVSHKLPRDYRGVTLKYGQGAAGVVAQTGQPVVIDDYRVWSRRAAVFEEEQPFGAVLGVPLIWQGATKAVLQVLADERHFTLSDMNLLRLLADQAVIALENTRLFGEVQQLAVTDELTGLANRRQLFSVAEHEFERAKRYGRPLSALMIDIDDFKRVNDRYGHGVGDQVLTGLADSLRRHVRGLDVIGRYGGEEFMAILPEVDEHMAHEIAERLRLAVAATPQGSDRTAVWVTISIGAATVGPDCKELSELVAAADRALYAAKQAGRNRTCAHVRDLALPRLNATAVPALAN